MTVATMKLFPAVAIGCIVLVAALAVGGGVQAAAVAVGAAAVGCLGLLALRGTQSERPAALARRPQAAEAAAVPDTVAAAAGEPAASLKSLVYASLAIHFIAAVILNLTGFADYIGPDHIVYRETGRAIADGWLGRPIDLSLVRGYAGTAYQVVNGVVWYLFRFDSSFILSVINGCLGTLTAWAVAKIATMIFGPSSARWAFAITAFTPSFIAWSTINVRDAWMWAAISVGLYAALVLRSRVSTLNLVLLGLSLITMGAFRYYVLILFAAGLAASYLVVRLRQLPYAIMSIVVVAFLFNMIGDGNIAVDPDNEKEFTLEELHRIRETNSEGGSGHAMKGDLRTPRGILLYLPYGLQLFLLTPYPWNVDSLRQGLAVPETLIWYVLLLAALQGMWRSAKTKLSMVAAPILVCAAITIAYSLTEGNEGTAFRHRAQSVIIFYVFAAGELARRWDRRLSGAPGIAAPAKLSPRRT